MTDELVDAVQADMKARIDQALDKVNCYNDSEDYVLSAAKFLLYDEFAIPNDKEDLENEDLTYHINDDELKRLSSGKSI